MGEYFYGMVLLVIGITLVLINCWLLFSEYKFYITTTYSNGKKWFYMGLNSISTLLSVICIIEGVIYLFVVHSQLS